MVLPIGGADVAWLDSLPELGEHTEVFDGIRRDGERIELFIEGIARYHIVAGRRIEIAVDPMSDRETAWFFLKATPFGLLIQQRGELPLHAGALVPPGGGPALLVAGDSGAGKSTTSASLVQRGWTLLNDDISRLTFEPDHAVVWPGFQSMKLNAASIQLLGLDPADLPRTRGFKEKYYWHLVGGGEPCRVGAMVVLVDPDASPCDPERLTGLDVLETVYQQTFRPYLVVPLGFQREHFAQVAQVVKTVPCLRINGIAGRTFDGTETLLRQIALDSAQ